MTHRMTPPDTTVTGVALDDETFYPDHRGVFDIPDEHAPKLAAQGWATLDSTDAKPPVGFASTKPRTRSRKTPDTNEKENSDD